MITNYDKYQKLFIKSNRNVQINLFKFKHKFRSYISLHPELFFPLVRLKKNSGDLAVSNSTNIVIEGFPRSGNSFAVSAFRFAQNKPVKIATHLHASAQIILACRKNIPTLVVIRNPIDAVVSLKALCIQCDSAFSPIALSRSWEDMFDDYIRFYQSIVPYQDKYVLGDFTEVIQDFGVTIQRINQRFNTDFNIFEHTEKNVRQVFECEGFHAGPNNRRKELKALLKEEIQDENLQPVIVKAENIYQKLLSNSI